jgi:hypothetical protein
MLELKEIFHRHIVIISKNEYLVKELDEDIRDVLRNIKEDLVKRMQRD